jgi:Tol biopolymer transport system component
MTRLRSTSILSLAFPAAALALASTAPAQSTVRVSVRSDGVQSSGASAVCGISGDGRFVGFSSGSPDLVAGDVNGLQDVFVHDTWTGSTELISVSTLGVQADADCYAPVLSADGRWVTYRSEAASLAPGDANGVSDIFLRDRLLGTTVRASVSLSGGDPDAWSYYSTLSNDGRLLCFQSEASNLVASDSNGTFDIFVRDLQAGTNELVSVSTSGAQTAPFQFNVEPSISADGRCVVFASFGENLAPGAINGFIDVFLRDRTAGKTETVSIGLGGLPANGTSGLPSASADGRYVAFVSAASNLVSVDTNGVGDVFVRDRVAGTTELVSVATDGTQASLDSYLYYSHPTISGDGRYVVFESYAHELVPGDSNNWPDVFLRDRLQGKTSLLSVTSGGQQVHLGATRATLSADGKRVVFESNDGHFVAGDTNDQFDAFLRLTNSHCEPVVVTCQGKINSVGCAPAIGASGLPTLSGPDAFFVTATAVRSHELGIPVLAFAPDSKPFGGGTLCVGAPLLRGPAQSSGGASPASDCSGVYSFHLDQAFLAQHGVGAGIDLWAQWVSRDQGFAPPDNYGLSAALNFTTCP